MTDDRPLEHLTDDELAEVAIDASAQTHAAASIDASAQTHAAASIEAMAYREIVRRREQGKSE